MSNNLELKEELKEEQHSIIQARRSFLGNSGKLVLSGTAIALMSGLSTASAKGMDTSKNQEQDVNILNSAIGAEHEAVAAYQVGAESGLLSKGILAVAVQFQGHHKAHIDVIAGTVKKLGGTAIDAKMNYN